PSMFRQCRILYNRSSTVSQYPSNCLFCGMLKYSKLGMGGVGALPGAFGDMGGIRFSTPTNALEKASSLSSISLNVSGRRLAGGGMFFGRGPSIPAARTYN